jgi:hypothetical protein
MSDNQGNEEKKIIIDEDWKNQVEAEKEAAEGHEHSEHCNCGCSGEHEQLPEPSLSFLVRTIYFQGAISLGLMPSPVTDKLQVKLDQAKHSIDLLAMIQEKTEGNRTSGESEELDDALHHLRMAFVAVAQQQGNG